MVACALLSGINSAPAEAEPVAKEQMQSLDEQVQEIKSDVLSIAAELSGLEEKLLYPSNTQVAVFVSLAEGETFRLDSVQVQLDGERVAHYISSFKELEALQKGGVQRIYTGNIAPGDHPRSVTLIGKLKNGKDFNQSDSFSFAKGMDPKTLGITLGGPEFGNIGIQVGDW